MQNGESSKRVRGCLGCGGCLLVIVVLIVAVPTIVFFTWSARSSREAEAELAQIRAAGEPTTPGELQSFYPTTPAERDAARRWLAAVQPLEGAAFQSAAEKLPIVGQSETEIPPPGQPWPDLQAAEKLLQQYEGSLQQLHAAAEAGRPARYPADFSQGLSMRLEHVQSLRAGTRLLLLEAHVRAHRGDAQGAARSIHAIFMLADSLRQEPVFMSQLVRYALDGIGQAVLQRQLPAVAFPDSDLDRIQAHLRAIDYSEGVQRAMMGERVMGITAIRDPSSMGPSGDLPVVSSGPFRNANLANYLKYMDRIVAATKLPWPQARLETAQIGGDIEAATSGGSVLSSPGHIMARLALPGTSRFLDAAVRATASNHATDAVIAVERFQRAHGRLPAKLEELVPKYLPQVPIDPFDGQPLRYVLRNQQYVIYSVGEDGVDNGGQGNDAGQPDLLFPVQRRQSEP